MRLNSLQNSAITLLENHLGDQSVGFTGKDSGEQAALRAISTYQSRTQTLGKTQSAVATSFSDDIISSLPVLLTPEVKKHLQTLDEFSKLGEKATDSQKQDAVEAYKAIGKTIKVAIVEKAIFYGIEAGLKDIPYIGPFAGTLARIAAHPLAEMAVAHAGSHINLQHKLINIALKAMGKEPISAEDHDLFMAKAIGKFAGGILQNAGQETAAGFRSDRSRPDSIVNSIG